jgi:ribosomal protein L11 methyltransferase
VTSWKLVAHAPKPIVEAALLAHDEIEDWDFDLVIAGREVAEDCPQDWVLEAWYPTRPGKAQRAALAGLFKGAAPPIKIEKLLDEDWLALSQAGAPPVEAGRFHVRTPDFAAKPGLIDLVIPAAQAFGTGQHQTSAGCLEMLGHMKARGMRARTIADIGSGTGLLGFAARALWPRATITLSDIDPVCIEVIEHNATLNHVPLGGGRGAVSIVVADGMDDPLLEVRGPYDLLLANILAGPLIALATDFADHVEAGGHVVLAGLLAGEQEARVRRAFRRAGFRLAARLQRGDWAILWLRRRHAR